MKINQFNTVTSINQKSQIIVGEKIGDEIQDIAVFDGGTEDKNMKLMMDLKRIAAQRELFLQEENKPKPTWKEQAADLAGGVGAVSGLLSGIVPSAYTAMVLESAVTPLSGPVGRLILSVVALTSMLGGGYLGYKVMKGGARKLLGLASEKQAEQKKLK